MRCVAAQCQKPDQFVEALRGTGDVEGVVAGPAVDEGVALDLVDVDYVVARSGVEPCQRSERRVVNGELVVARTEVDLKILDVLEGDAARLDDGAQGRAALDGRDLTDLTVGPHAKSGDPEEVQGRDRCGGRVGNERAVDVLVLEEQSTFSKRVRGTTELWGGVVVAGGVVRVVKQQHVR